MLRINQIKIPVSQHETQDLEKKIHKILNTKATYIYKISKLSIDAREKERLLHIYTVDVELENQALEKKYVNNKNIMLTNEVIYQFPTIHPVCNWQSGMAPPVIVGAGPAGYFAALYLARAGYQPIVVERGKPVEERTRDVEAFWDGEAICANSNVSFGEGGAGTFSDGKLNTGIKDKKGRIQAVIRDFIQYGAPKDIGYLNKPHIGTDALKKVLANMRLAILELGGQILFEHQFVDIEKRRDGMNTLSVLDLQTNQVKKIKTGACILAIGHSARDTFILLQKKQVPMEPKSFAIGLRIEHKRKTIDQGQYGTSSGAGLLPAADYKMTYRATNQRSVYSFCMCPGGFVVNASSGPGQSVVNGMSNHARDEENSNSAIVVNVTPEDFIADGFKDAGELCGVEFQKKYEALSYREGKGGIPVQRFEDYCKGIISDHFGEIKPNIRGSYTFGNLNNCLPPYVNNAIIEGICYYDDKLHGFKDADAVLSGIESRTSSPVRILRNEAYMSEFEGLFPCGEGAGYAGGITSAAVDGIKVAEAVANYLERKAEH